jgi:hypothetical protein
MIRNLTLNIEASGPMPVNTDQLLAKCLDALSSYVQPGESIVRVRLAEPQLASHADYFTKYKAEIARKNSSGTEITARRCLVIKISSNTGVAQVDETLSCGAVKDIKGLEE